MVRKWTPCRSRWAAGTVVVLSGPRVAGLENPTPPRQSFPDQRDGRASGMTATVVWARSRTAFEIDPDSSRAAVVVGWRPTTIRSQLRP
jgi:hypothetical protein